LKTVRKLLSTTSQNKAEYHEHEKTSNNVAKWLRPLMKKAICTLVYIPKEDENDSEETRTYKENNNLRSKKTMLFASQLSG